LSSSVSPDGSHIYYNSEDSGIFIAYADGELPTLLTLDGIGPAVSPDGAMLAFTSRGELRVMSADGGRSRTLPQRLVAYDPSWSSDGTRIVFEAWRDHENASIYIINVDGSGLQELAASATSPSWSPDGSRIGGAWMKELPSAQRTPFSERVSVALRCPGNVRPSPAAQLS